MKDSEEYALTLESIEQGKTFYDTRYNESDYDGFKYREEKMTENFLRELNSIGKNESVFGSYGGGHTEMFSESWYDYVDPGTGNLPFDCMTVRLRKYLCERLNVIQLYEYHEILPLRETESK